MNPALYYPPDVDLHFDLLTAEEETRLFHEAHGGNETSRAYLIKNHLLFAAMFARRLAKNRLPEPEVVSAANLGLMKAFDRFDHTRGSRFSSYLKPFIQGEISRLWKAHFTERAEIPEDMLTDVPGVCQAGQLCAVESPQENEDDQEHLEYLLGLVEKFKDHLNPHEREILTLHYQHGKTFADIGRERIPAVSREAIRASHARALEKLKRAFLRAKIPSTQ